MYLHLKYITFCLKKSTNLNDLGTMPSSILSQTCCSYTASTCRATLRIQVSLNPKSMYFATHFPTYWCGSCSQSCHSLHTNTLSSLLTWRPRHPPHSAASLPGPSPPAVPVAAPQSSSALPHASAQPSRLSPHCEGSGGANSSSGSVVNERIGKEFSKGWVMSVTGTASLAPPITKACQGRHVRARHQAGGIAQW